MKKILYLFAGAAALLCTSCLKKGSTTYTTSDDASVKTFYIKKNDSVSNIQNVVFKVDNTQTRGQIYNQDSLAYGTRVDSLYPSITATASYVSSIQMEFRHKGKDTSVYYTGAEPIDFTGPVTMTILASDQTHVKQYTVRINVHQVEPNLYVWKRLKESVYATGGTTQKAVWFGQKIYWYVNDGLRTVVYQSADGKNWSDAEETTLAGSQSLDHIVEFGGRLTYAHDGRLYESTDGIQWTAVTAPVDNLLFVMDGRLYGIGQDSIYRTSDGAVWSGACLLPSGFPTQQYASVSYKSRTDCWTTLVMGGVDPSGRVLSSRWTTENGVRWMQMTSPRQAFEPITGAALVHYNKQLLLFGGMDGSMRPIEQPVQYSDDNGLTWFAADTTYNRLSLESDYGHRGFQSAVLDGDEKKIYLLGGRDRTTLYTDVWCGMINSIYFK